MFCLKTLLMRLLNLISHVISGDLVKDITLLNLTLCEISGDLVKDSL